MNLASHYSFMVNAKHLTLQEAAERYSDVAGLSIEDARSAIQNWYMRLS